MNNCPKHGTPGLIKALNKFFLLVEVDLKTILFSSEFKHWT